MANRKRRSRKARTGGGTGARPAPRAVASERRAERATRATATKRQSAAATRTLGTVGERPPSPFGGLPVSETAIFVGLIGVIVGFLAGGGPALYVGALICGLGVTEVTAREHFSGFRSHAALLAAIPAVVLEIVIVLTLGQPRNRSLLLLPVIPVFAACFWLLRRSFLTARHARVTRPPTS